MKLSLNNSIDVEKARTRLEYLIKKKANIELSEKLPSRSTDSNSYLHVCIAIFSDATGYDREEILELMSHQAPEVLRYDKAGHNFRRSTTKLNSKEMSILIELIRSVAKEELGIYIPNGDEFRINQFQLEKQYLNGK